MLGAPHDMRRHRGVDLLREFDQSQRGPGSARRVREIDGIDRNAVPADTRAGAERLEAEGFRDSRSRGAFPHIDPQAPATTASSLTRAMFTLRYVFSRSFASSASRAEPASTTWSHRCRKKSAAAAVHRGV